MVSPTIPAISPGVGYKNLLEISAAGCQGILQTFTAVDFEFGRTGNCGV
jgi:hypothetical protein